MIQTTQPHRIPVGWAPSFEEAPDPRHFHIKAQRSVKRAVDKVRARRAEDRHIMELAEFHHPFMEA